MMNSRRRKLLQAALASPLAGGAFAARIPGDPWIHAQEIIDRLSAPLPFRDEDFDVTAFGARRCELVKVTALVSHHDKAEIDTPAPGSPDCHAAFNAAIEACNKAGGGRVVIPAGDWFCAGPIVLLSNVHVHLTANARLFFSPRPEDYAKHGDFDCGPNGKLVRSRWQGNDCLNLSSMVYAFGQDHIALTGEDAQTSVLDGQGGVPFDGDSECWWTWKGRDRTLNAFVPAPKAGKDRPRDDEYRLPAQSEAGVPLAQRVYGLGHFLRPSMIHLLGCTNVLLQGYRVRHTPFWQHHPVHCRNLVIRGVHMLSLGPNNDGFDPESCDHVLVEHCTFDTGDDCIAIKSGKNLDTQYGPSQNIVIQHCVMQSGHGAVTLGSEMAGGIQNVYAQHLLMQNARWRTNPLNTAIRLKTNMNRGGYLRNFHVRHVQLPNGVQTSPSFYAALPGSPLEGKNVASAAGAVVTIDCDYTPRADPVRSRPPLVSQVHISDVTVGNVATLQGPASCWQALVIVGPIAFDYNGPPPMPAVLPVSDVTITRCDFGTPANAARPFFLHHVADVRLKDVIVAGKRYEDTTLSS